MRVYMCVHDYDAYLRQVIKAAKARACPGIRVEYVIHQRDRQILAVEARSEEDLQCWITDMNADGNRERVHRVEGPEDEVCARRQGTRRTEP